MSLYNMGCVCEIQGTGASKPWSILICFVRATFMLSQ